jgi:hypothetical protein
MKYQSTIILPSISSMMTGVWKIDRTHNLVVLTYEDHTREAGMIPAARWEEIKDNAFAIVSEVQSQRRKEATELAASEENINSEG